MMCICILGIDTVPARCHSGTNRETDQ